MDRYDAAAALLQAKLYNLGEVAGRDLPTALQYAAANAERAFAVGDVLHSALTAHLNDTDQKSAEAVSGRTKRVKHALWKVGGVVSLWSVGSAERKSRERSP